MHWVYRIVRSHVADCAEHESECDDWEEVVAEGGRGRTGPYETACHLYLQPSGQPSAQPHGGNQHEYCNENFRYRRFTHFFFSFTPYSCWSVAVSSIILCRHSPRVNGSHEAEVQRAQVCLNWTEQSVVQYPLVSFSVTQLYNLVSKHSPSATRL